MAAERDELISLAKIAESEASCAQMSGMRAVEERRRELTSLANRLRWLAGRPAVPSALPPPNDFERAASRRLASVRGQRF
jgi:hypothetical protein